MNTVIDYEMRLINTSAATGYFGCFPVADPDFDTALELLMERPLDDFLRRHLLTQILAMDEASRQCRLQSLAQANDEIARSLAAEICVVNGEAPPECLAAGLASLAACTPLIYLRAAGLSDQELHHQWNTLFGANLERHRPLPAPDYTGLPMPGPRMSPVAPCDHGRIAIDRLFTEALAEGCSEEPWAPEQTIATALERLEGLEILDGPEQRHLASLSPIAFLRRWRLERQVRSRRNRFGLRGLQTSYGKGLSQEAARASCLMEIVERTSAFASVDGDRLPDTLTDHRLRFGTYGDLLQKGWPTLDPGHLALEVPYQDQALHWIQGHDRLGGPLWVPAQTVFLFCNLDEVSLCDALGSTGLASGNSPDGARVAALLEVLERDAQSIIPFDPRSCFNLDSHNPHLAPLFEAYRGSGITVQFQDITTEFGVPCYRAFVVRDDGTVITGTGAHLDGRKAVMAALTEITYPFPAPKPTRSGYAGRPTVLFEDLPNYDTHNRRANLTILERLLGDRGYEPVYVDLTRKDLGIPVVRAIVPGLEVVADFDRFSRVPSRLFANYLNGQGVFDPRTGT